MPSTQAAVLLSLLAGTISAHGNITSPPARQPGPAMLAACGQPAVDAVMSDPTNPLEDIPLTAAGSDCRLDLCRGATFADNAANLQTYSPGQRIRMLAILPIPHEGPMNVSIVDTATNTVIGPPLIEFTSYADENLAQLPANNTDFEVVLPAGLGDKCTKPGECTMQWFWFGTRAQQTYESCVDFVIGSANTSEDVAAGVPASTGLVTSSATLSSGVAVPPVVSTSGGSFTYRRKRRPRY